MRNAILCGVLISISYWIANVMPTDGGPIAMWSGAACIMTGVCGFMAGVSAGMDLA